MNKLRNLVFWQQNCDEGESGLVDVQLDGTAYTVHLNDENGKYIFTDFHGNVHWYEKPPPFVPLFMQ